MKLLNKIVIFFSLILGGILLVFGIYMSTKFKNAEVELGQDNKITLVLVKVPTVYPY